MEKIKDFIYDKNDILVALLVLVLAALLIWWRMDVIMEYPEKVFADAEQSGSELEMDEPSGSESEEGQQAGQDGGDAEGESEETPDVPADNLWQGGVLTRDVQVDVYGNSAMAAVQCLVDAGLFDDYNDYKNICDASGLNHEKVSAGSLTFAKGSTKEQVARKINWS